MAYTAGAGNNNGPEQNRLLSSPLPLIYAFAAFAAAAFSTCRQLPPPLYRLIAR